MDWWQHVPDYSTWTLQTYLFYALFGLMGGLLRIARGGTPVTWPRRTEDGFIRLGALGVAISASIVGMLADHNPLLATMAGVVAPEIVETLVNVGVAFGQITSGKGFRRVLWQWVKGYTDDDK